MVRPKPKPKPIPKIETIEKVREAIKRTYRNNPSTLPDRLQIIEENGLAQKSFYRVLDYEQCGVLQELEDFENIYSNRPSADTSDPLRANPEKAIDELLTVIANLTTIIEEQNVKIGELKEQLGLEVVDLRAAR